MEDKTLINEVIHAPMRLRICGMLRGLNALDFTAIRDNLNVSDSSLSKHLRILEDAGYVMVKKESSLTRLDSRRITWISLTKDGQLAFDVYIKTISGIIAIG